MSFDIDVVGRRGDTRIAARFATGAGVTVLVGPSGAGKTSVLHMIAGLVQPERGHVRIGEATLFDAAAGIDVPVARRRAGYVFQEARLFPHLSVRGNLNYGAPSTVRAELVDASPIFEKQDGPSTSSGRTEGGQWQPTLDGVAAMLDIAGLLDRWPRTLSGGEARRVAIGRALLSDPAFLLLDEPLSSLDPARREETARAIERVRDGWGGAVGLPILLVTHDEREAARLGSEIVTL